MKNFYRSLRYLKPYRARITVAIVCVVVIAALWGLGLGIVLPAAKILIADEGLHGWAYLTVASDRMDATLVLQKAPFGSKMAGMDGTAPIDIESVVNIANVRPGGPAAKAGLTASDWIVGLADGQAEHYRLRDDQLVRLLGKGEEGRKVSLWVLGRHSLPPPGKERDLVRPKQVDIAMGQARFSSRSLARIADMIPDPGNDYSKRYSMYLGLLVLVLVVTFVRAFFTYIQEYLVGTAIWQGIMDLRGDNYNVVLHLPTTFFSEKGVSDATSRFVQDTSELARGQNTLLGKTMVEPAKAVACLLVALGCSWQLTLMALVGGPPAFFFIRQFGKKMHRASRRALESWSLLLENISETLQGIRVVKAYTMEGAERRRFFRISRQLLRQQNRMERLDAATGPTVEALGITAGMVAAGIAGYLVFHYQLDRDLFLTWMGSLFAMFDPVRKLSKVAMRFQASDAAAARIFELQDTPQEPRVASAAALERLSDHLEFRGVSYRYPGAAGDAVRDIDLTVRAGTTVAIVGPNGCGKTTLVSLVPRLIDPTRGCVLMDGQDVSRCSVRSLRRQIGLVTQDSVLFHATIAENISYGLHRARREDVLAAARGAFVDEFVCTLPEGYDTMVGEHGATLSGGQKQRITIARAILRDPAILIFDEATSQIDADSERRIHQAMEVFAKGRTTLLIAHRFATVLSADRIVVMNQGQIIDAGTHDELLGRCELYHHLYRTQFVDSGG